MEQEREGPPRCVKPLVWLMVILLLAAVGYGVYRLAAVFNQGLDQVAERHARQAKIVRAQKEAGREYMEEVLLDVEFLPPDEPGGRGRLQFNIDNTGDREVKKAVAEVHFGSLSGAEAHVEELIIFDDTSMSVRPDRPLGPGEKREIVQYIDSGDDWDWGDVQYRLKNMRLDPEAEGGR